VTLFAIFHPISYFEILGFPSTNIQQIDKVVNESYRTVEEVSRNLDGKKGTNNIKIEEPLCCSL